MNKYYSFTIIFLLTMTSCGGSAQKRYNASDSMYIQVSEIDESEWNNDYEDGVSDYSISDESSDIFNPWNIDYFKDVWGDKDTSNPFIYAILSGTGWNIHLDFIPPTENTPNGSFRFYLIDRDGHFVDMYGPVNILVRGSDNETRIVEVTGEQDGIAFVEDPDVVEGFKRYLDNDEFDILMEFEKYNERHKTKARWNSPGHFNKMVERYL